MDPQTQKQLASAYLNERCFPAHTRIQTSRSTSTAISALRVGDVVLAFDARADKGRGALVPRRVTRLYRNTTTNWIRLCWLDGTAREVLTTPGHHFLDELGLFPTIEEMTLTGSATVVLASGTQTTMNLQQNYDRDHQSGTAYDHTAIEDRRPILFDLNGNGIEVATLDRSTTFVDSNGDGLQHRTAWAGDGALFYDAGMDGLITEQREYVFTEWDATAKDDMAALRSRFDSNGDERLVTPRRGMRLDCAAPGWA